jgi:hypothetical protein
MQRATYFHLNLIQSNLNRNEEIRARKYVTTQQRKEQLFFLQISYLHQLESVITTIRKTAQHPLDLFIFPQTDDT